MNALVIYHRRSFAILFFLCLQAIAWGQPKANYTASPVSGCSPLVVYFSDSSTGNPTSWKWDLGNGVSSFLRNPSATYFNPGTYSVKLVVSNAAGSDSIVKTRLITVYSNPVATFAFDKETGCFPLAVHFTDQSMAGSGQIVSWQWDFGDGSFSSEQHPSHTYTAPGIYSVTLRVTNSFGCVKTFTKAQAINITNGVKAAFTFTDPGACPAPATAQFTNTSTGPGPLRFQWSFGDGNSSNAINPVHTYNNNGNYTVRLVAISPQGCTDTFSIKEAIKIGTAKADFTYPAACINKPVTFNNITSPTPARVEWDFGDATNSTSINPVKTYTRPGLYTVRLISHFGVCSDTIKKLITVNPKPIAAFQSARQSFCSLPANVQFTSLTTGTNLQYAWDFGDGNISSLPNPTHTYTSDGTFTVKLIVTSAAGCSDTLVKAAYIQVQRPRIQFSGLPKNGCAPVTITPTATVLGNHTITGYQWSFGDGTTSTSATPSHTYSKTGTYDVQLTVTTASGCSDMAVYTKAVRVGEKPKANFTHTPVTVCPYDRVYFIDKSTGTIDQWFWDFGDGGTSTEQNPVHQYGDTGWHHVRLVVYNNTCPDTIVIRNAVYVNPPISIFGVDNNCNDKFTKRFTDRSLAPKTWFWEFGDGTTSTEQNPAHRYASTGTYRVRLTVANNNCTHFSEQTVMVIDEKAGFASPDTLICRNSEAVFTSKGINSNSIANWVWDFGDGTGSTDANASRHTYATAGTYMVTLSITDLLGCKSTKRLQVKVYGPTAAFTPSVAAICLKDNKVAFNDRSTTDGQHPIVKWIWNYGDNTIDSTAQAPYQHSYAAAGTYSINLTVVDAHGCRDSRGETAAVVIAQPIAQFLVSDTITCTEKTIAFQNTSTGVEPTYNWTFGDGNRSTDVNPSHAYAATGLYSIKLLVTDKYGCQDSLVKPGLISITYPKAMFTLSDSVGTCPPLLVRFTNQSSNYTSIHWDFGDGNHSTLDAPSHFYSVPGTFYATLIATGPGGCTDTMRRKIVVKGPSGSFSYAPLSGCKPLTVNFTATAKNHTSFIWDFSDGSTQASKDSTISHTYVTAGDFVPKIILTDAGGCNVALIGTDTIRVMDVVTDFEMNATSFCNSGVVQFSNRTVSNDYITSYQWRFGDSTISTEMNPVHHFTKPGAYTVELLVTTQSGCTDKKVVTNSLKVFANPVIQIVGDSASCAPALFTYKGQAASSDASLLKWDWNLGNGQTSTLQNPLPQTYAADGNYTITAIATNLHGCSDTATKTVAVYPVPQTNAGADQWICRGSFYQLKASGATTYSWKESSSLSCLDCESPLAAPTESTQYIVTGFNGFGCSKSDSVTVGVHQPFTLSTGRGDTICVGSTIRLAASGADQYTWTPAVDVKNPASGTTTATPQTSTLYKVVAKDNHNCFTDTGSVFIKVWPIPTVSIGDAQSLVVGNTIALKPQYSPDVTSYQWSNAQTLSCATCPEPVAKPKTATKYTIDVKNDGGCPAKDEVTVNVICNDGNLFVPNTFSPNTDGRNDVFYPRGTGISSIKSLKVFNRWGEMVFSRENFSPNDAAAGWDGTFKGQALAPDVYIYTCEVVCMNVEILNFKGDVTLLR